jgi:hypothetical protein
MSAPNGRFDGQVDTEAPPSGDGCEECLEQGSWWVHLRRCAACGHVGCCNDSLNRHATAHATEAQHRFVQSFEPGEEWFWDYTSEIFLADGPTLFPPASHPSSQPAPGPEGMVPANWLELLDERNRREAAQ